MLADNKPWNPEIVEKNLPLYASIKLDGIRCLVHNGTAYSRSLKPLPNECLQNKIFRFKDVLEGFDGEIIVGNPTSETCFKDSHRACMKGDLEANHHFYIFDMWNQSDLSFMERLLKIKVRLLKSSIPWVTLLNHEMVYSMTALENFSERALLEGHEGSILQRSDGLYKHGRATTNSGLMYKRKSFVDTEVTITEFHELMGNNNPKTQNELGNSVRSSHKENLVPRNTLGAVSCSGFFENGEPFTCKIGVFRGFTKEDLQYIWDHKDEFKKKKLKMRYMDIGKDKAPRNPVALGFRDEIDLD